MSHTYEKVSGNKAKLTFTFPAEQFDEALQKAFLKLRGRINVPGFRRGKAPRKMIETMYGESVFYDDAFDMIFPDAYSAAVKEEDMHPVDQPQLKLDQIGKGQDLIVTAEVFVRPDVTLGEYKNLEVEIEPQKVTDAMIDARIAQDQDKVSRVIDVEDRPVQQGDTVNLDYAGSVDGVPFDGGTAQGQQLVIGSGSFIPGFEDQMVGLSVGEEKDLQVTFPEEYHAKELAGKEAVFHVKVNGIQVTEKPELDDDFAADVSDFSTYQEYRDDIVKQLTEQVEKNNRNLIENAVLAKAALNAEMDIPAAMIETRLDYMVEDMSMNMRYQGITLDDFLKYTGQTMEHFREGYRAQAESRVRNELVIEAIIKAEGIEPTEEEIDKATEDQAKAMGRDAEEFRKGLTDSQKEYLKESAAIRKALDLMIDSAKVTEKKEEAPEEEAAQEEAPAETAEEKPAKKPARKRTAKKAEEAAKEQPADE